MQNDNNMNDGLRLAWRSQTDKPLILSQEELERRAHSLETKVRWRNFGEYAAAALIATASAYFFFEFHTVLLRLGASLIAAGVGYVIWQLARHGSASAPPSDMTFASSLDFLTTQLKRQRDLLRRIWSWYLLPLFPGLTVFIFGLSQLPSSSGRGLALPQPTMVHATLACVISLALVAALNRAAARRLQRDIELIDALRNGGYFRRVKGESTS